MAGVVENTPEYDPSSKLPLKLQGKVVHGFGRGSRQLGFPTGKLNISKCGFLPRRPDRVGTLHPVLD